MKRKTLFQRTAKSRRYQIGVTLLEMLVVMSIFAILAVISYLGVKENLPRWRLKAATRMIRGDMVDIKSRASRDMREYRLNFTSDTSYQMEIGNARAASTIWQTPADRPGLMLITRTLSKDEGVTGGDDISFPGVTIDTATSTSPIFRSSGILRPGMGNISVNLSNDKSDSLTVSVSMAGRIRIED